MKKTREEIYSELREQYRNKWLNEALDTAIVNREQYEHLAKTPAQTFAKQIGLYDGEDKALNEANWGFDIDNGKDITDYSDSEGGEVIVR